MQAQLLADDLSILHLLAFCLSALSNWSSSFPLPHPCICICIFHSIPSSFPLPYPCQPAIKSLWFKILYWSIPFCTIPPLLYCYNNVPHQLDRTFLHIERFCLPPILGRVLFSFPVFFVNSLLASNCKSSPDDGIGHRFTHHPINIILRNVHLSRFFAFWTNTSSPKYIVNVRPPQANDNNSPIF